MKGTQRRRCSVKTRYSFERLEIRALLSGAEDPFAVLVDNVLVVTGTAQNDQIEIKAGTSKVLATHNGESLTFPRTSSTRATIEALAGDDTITIWTAYTPFLRVAEVSIDGGEGEDHLNLRFAPLASDTLRLTDHGWNSPGLGSYVNVESALFDPAESGDVIWVDEISVDVAMTIAGGIGDDLFYLPPANAIEGDVAHITLLGGDGYNSLTIDDSTDTSGQEYLFTPDTIGRGDLIMSHSGFGMAKIIMGTGDDHVSAIPSAETVLWLIEDELGNRDTITITLEGATGVEIHPGGFFFDNRARIQATSSYIEEKTVIFDSGDHHIAPRIGALFEGLWLDVRDGARINFDFTYSLTGLTVADGGEVRITPSGDRSVTVRELSLPPGSRIDVTDNYFILDYSTVSPVGIWTGEAYDGISGHVQAGRIMSSLSSGTLKTLAVVDVSTLTGWSLTQTIPFLGQAVDTSSVVVKFTWGGDAHMDGKITIDDYGRIDANVARSGSVWGWMNGDFNYDGVINIDDYGIIDSNLNEQDEVL